MTLPLHDPTTCTREVCGKCRASGQANPPKPVDHKVQKRTPPRGKREIDLGRLLQKLGRRIEDEGQTTSQSVYEWERVTRIRNAPPSCPVCDGKGCRDCNGTGDARHALDDTLKQHKEDRAASELRSEWWKVRLQLEALCNRADWLMDQARSHSGSLEKHRTPAQVEADGWCGSCWKSTGELVPITMRPSGEPYYRGRCRFCGSWPGGDPPRDVLEKRLSSGREPRVRAS